MKGIQFVVNDAGEKQAVLIDLTEWGELWEDFYDLLVAHARQDEEEVSWEELKQEIEAEANVK
ncbi:hypothetical protein [Planktothrix pseudagardhii]|uniref:Uncharacterized protein n=1 Tax=Planktothrix pseudagardhii TaxID=132604 RepID=A0A9W4G666_9CYAN|nr:hypothetical protein [Planktothrix pseudagardhii]CAD5942169.1 hypothetical protein NO713_01994 [Planktothrix pseudagardhii]